MSPEPVSSSNALLVAEFSTLQVATLLFALSALLSLAFWFSRKPVLGKILWLTFLLATVVLSACLVTRWLNVGHIPYVQLYETLLFSVWSLGLVALVTDQMARTRLASTIGSIAGTLVLVYILQWSEESRKGLPLSPALQSPWLDVHIATAFLSYAGFAISAGAAAVYLFNRKEEVDRLSYRLVAFSFPLLGLAIILGAVWGNVAWGRYWGWDPKETASLVTWLIYAGYLHSRMVLGWKGVKASVLNLIGFAAVLFTWLGLNLLSGYISSLHTYAGT